MEPDALFRTVRTILMRDWDPIGVNDEPAAQDEYDDYVGAVVRMLREHASAEAVYRYLRDVETTTIGLQGDPEKTRRVAESLSTLRT